MSLIKDSYNRYFPDNTPRNYLPSIFLKAAMKIQQLAQVTATAKQIIKKLGITWH